MVNKPQKRSKASKEEENISDIFNGPIKERRYGLRVDDEVDVTVIAGNTLMNVEGRVLAFNDDMEIVDVDGFYHRIIMDWVVDIKIKKHNRPPQNLDPEFSKRPPRAKAKKTHVDQAYS
ncbi:MAG: hypothetical protein KAH57_06895 [Thermoplasmata archaeon]|nr:hypothetical protein [Thermoplasmata archaeon]